MSKGFLLSEESREEYLEAFHTEIYADRGDELDKPICVEFDGDVVGSLRGVGQTVSRRALPGVLRGRLLSTEHREEFYEKLDRPVGKELVAPEFGLYGRSLSQNSGDQDMITRNEFNSLFGLEREGIDVLGL